MCPCFVRAVQPFRMQCTLGTNAGVPIYPILISSADQSLFMNLAQFLCSLHPVDAYCPATQSMAAQAHSPSATIFRLGNPPKQVSGNTIKIALGFRHDAVVRARGGRFLSEVENQ